MAEVIEAVLGSNSDAENKTEIADVRKVPEIKERKTPCQSKDKEREKLRKILAKVKSALQDNAEKRKKGRKSTILVCYRRHSKVKTENQLKMKTEEESLSPLRATPYACQGPKISK
ncbi:uncharacterized protein LOC144307851 [Canis aureus]